MSPNFLGVLFERLPRTLTASLVVPMLVVALGAAISGCATEEAEEIVDPDVQGPAVNPDGVAYPTDSIGRSARAGSRRGDRIPNLAFRGYPESDRASGFKTIALADYYDPQQRRHKLLHLQVAATWCSICSSETDASVKVKEALAERGAVILQVVINGSTYAKGPSLDEVDGWMDRHKTSFTVAVDVRGRRVSGLGMDVVPWNALIDTRTMEIIHSSSGAPDDVGKYVQGGLAWVAKNPPSF